MARSSDVCGGNRNPNSLRTHAVTVLPSVASLKVLRGKSTLPDAAKPLIGFADPVFDRDQQQLQNVRVAANVAAARGFRGGVADIAELRTALPPLPETADELRKVAAGVHANAADIILGPNATETRVKQAKLDQYRIVYFATHGLLAGEVADFAKLNAEPALVLSLPEHPTEFDDGLLTASEVAKLNSMRIGSFSLLAIPHQPTSPAPRRCRAWRAPSSTRVPAR